MIGNLINYLRRSDMKGAKFSPVKNPIEPWNLELLNYFSLERLEHRIEESTMAAQSLLTLHPGRVLLEEFLVPKGISVWHLAKDIGVPVRRIYEIVQGQRSINADIAHRLAHYLGMSQRY
jgi:addiction module HigA family antidote